MPSRKMANFLQASLEVAVVEKAEMQHSREAAERQAAEYERRLQVGRAGGSGLGGSGPVFAGMGRAGWRGAAVLCGAQRGQLPGTALTNSAGW